MRLWKRIGRSIIAAAGLALAACTSAATPATPIDASFAWGCWVAKDEPGGDIHGFLRLLKNGADGEVFEGYLHDVRGGDMIPVLHLTLARDGTRAIVVLEGETTEFAATEPIGDGLQFKTVTLGKTDSLSLTGGHEQLSLAIQIGSDTRTFAFERDGCD